MDSWASSGKSRLVGGTRQRGLALYSCQATVAESQRHQQILMVLLVENACQTKISQTMDDAAVFLRRSDQ